MIVILFGQTGAGKNYVGNLLAAHFNFHFWDGDEALSLEMKASVKLKQPFTQAMRDQLTGNMIAKIAALTVKYENIAVAQALYKEQNRKQIQAAYPNGQFIWITASPEQIILRLTQRGDEVDNSYANVLKQFFEEPTGAYQTIINNSNQDAVLTQLRKIFQEK